MNDQLPSVAALLDRFAPNRAAPLPPVASLSWHGRQRPEVQRLLDYLAAFGPLPKSPEELLTTIHSLPNEEEIGAFRVVEGVAVSHASSGRFVLFIA